MVKIYELIDSRDKLPFYIGKTGRDLELRLKEHLSDKYSCKKTAWIKYLLKNNVKIEINVIDEVDEKYWKFWECHYISLYKSWNFDLKNDTIGGDGVTSSPEMIIRRVASLNVIINKIDRNGNIVQQYSSMRNAANDNGLKEHLVRTSHKYNLFRGDFKYIRA